MTEPPVVDPAAVERLRRLGGANLVRQMLELYLAQGPQRIRSLLDGAATEEADRVERSAHTMKSSAGNVGALRLQLTAEGLEAAAGAGIIDHVMVERLVRQYEESAAVLRGVLEEENR
ncbi:MAG TPA: Hpt domain-containing protein [Longimicrobiales bacterium]|nr:Hpt domain-containing protein [Longimicrobiales bacterium]